MYYMNAENREPKSRNIAELHSGLDQEQEAIRRYLPSLVSPLPFCLTPGFHIPSGHCFSSSAQPKTSISPSQLQMTVSDVHHHVSK